MSDCQTQNSIPLKVLPAADQPRTTMILYNFIFCFICVFSFDYPCPEHTVNPSLQCKTLPTQRSARRILIAHEAQPSRQIGAPSLGRDVNYFLVQRCSKVFSVAGLPINWEEAELDVSRGPSSQPSTSWIVLVGWHVTLPPYTGLCGVRSDATPVPYTCHCLSSSWSPSLPSSHSSASSPSSWSRSYSHSQRSHCIISLRNPSILGWG